jgi:hypothetical protein
MDIICAYCGRHLRSIEAAREHSRQCKKSKGETVHWLPSKKSKLTKEEWAALVKLINNPQIGSITDKKTTDEKGSSKDKVKKIISRIKLIPKWLIALLFILVLSLCGWVVSIVIGSLIPLWLFLGFSIIYSCERWLRYITRKYKWLGKTYKLLLNVSILSLFGLIIWSGVMLFSQEFPNSPIVGSFIFIAELVLFGWICRVGSRNSWRWPSMKLTVFSLIVLFVIFAFAGVEPMVSYKESAFSAIGALFENSSEVGDAEEATQDSTAAPPTLATPTPTQTALSTSTPPTVTLAENTGINKSSGEYDDYFLGLVKAPDGVIGGSDCYGEFIILINNMDAQNPTYSELLSFLKSDNTDEFPYQYTISVVGFYYGEAEDRIDLDNIKDIIDGVAQPSPPRVCADFAERLHNNAEKAGIRCGYVSLDMSGYTDPYNFGIASDAGHACNVFETTDKGLVYIDCTGTSGMGPENQDTIVNIQVGAQYNPQYLFPSGGWYIPSGVMGTVIDMFITWDGDWR